MSKQDPWSVTRVAGSTYIDFEGEKVMYLYPHGDPEAAYRSAILIVSCLNTYYGEDRND